MSNPNRLAAEWQLFYRKVLPDGASEVQITENSRAFYCGAEAAVMRVLLQSFDKGSDCSKDDKMVVVHLAEELSQFAEDMKKGKA